MTKREKLLTGICNNPKAVRFDDACRAAELLQGIAWRWQSIDGAMMKAPLAQESVGANPTDRGKKWEQAPSAGGRAWRPVIDRRDRGEPA